MSVIMPRLTFHGRERNVPPSDVGDTIQLCSNIDKVIQVISVVIRATIVAEHVARYCGCQCCVNAALLRPCVFAVSQ